LRVQLKKPIGASLAVATCGLLGALPAAPAAAQEINDWDVTSSLLFYGEDNNRVKDVSLDVSIRRALDEDHSFNLDFTVDSLTGATPNGAVPTSDYQTFTGASGSNSYTINPGEAPLDPTFMDTRIAGSANWQQSFGDASRWNLGLSGSGEHDYFHFGVNGRLEHDFNLKNTTVFAGLAYGRDEVSPIGGAPDPLTPMLPPPDQPGGIGEAEGEGGGGGPSHSKDVYDGLVGVTQILSRRSLVELSYSYGRSSGYLNDPYKILSVVDPVTGLPVYGDLVPGGAGIRTFLYLYESRPDTRTKQSLFAEWRHAFDRDSMALSVRAMTDDWGIDSRTIETHYRWNINDHSFLEPHLRYYTQTAADFYHTVLFAGDALPAFASADYRLADLNAYTVGLKYGHDTAGGEFAVRLEYYRQDGTPSPGSAVGELANYELIQPLAAAIVQFDYRFRY
jgi:Protein of unknown function (DUF3570)